MNIEEYISTGILESYALGDVSPQERESVEKNLERYPELREELARIESAQERLLFRTSVTPGPAVREKIFSSISRATPTQLPARGLIRWKFAAAASISAAVISLLLAYNFWNKWKVAESSLDELNARNEQIAEDYERVSERLDQIENDLAVIGNPDFQRVVMEGTANAPEAMAYVYWNISTEEVYLEVKNLAELTQQNQYQLWAIIDGKPVDAGVFDVSGTGVLIKMKHIPIGASVFAVTVEPRGGRPTPSLATMQVAGQVERG